MTSERGLALVSALLLMAVMSGLVIALTANSQIEVAMSDNEELYAQARAAAESGLNHAAALIMAQANTVSFQPNTLLAGPDGLANAATASATVNADNGLMTHLIAGTPPWDVSANSNYSYHVR